ncbi:MAG: D-aminoacyl-tRNA deacylase [Thermoplasmata archaeon]|nr:D-aminoacyl-tRNA deacylase [Thermoplasmata archaeon]
MSVPEVGTPSTIRYLVVVSEEDPVATAVARQWGSRPATGDHLDGAAIRTLSDQALLVHRPGFHIHDDLFDQRLPAQLRRGGVTLVFPSVHRSESNIPTLTVHPIGNPGDAAEVGGRPRTLVPTDPRLMASALRALSARSKEAGMTATFEATHHGPAVELPAMFVEIGFGEDAVPPASAVRILADTIPTLELDGEDRIAMAIGGGHYAPHFTDLVLKRRWAFGHILSRHALASLDRETARRAYELTVGAEGWLAARVDDAGHSALTGVGVRLRDSDAPPRPRAGTPPTDASGT